ncbi:MAG: hypothetical protein Fur0025_18920 [Oscillatoriaceae cyanobacterium]
MNAVQVKYGQLKTNRGKALDFFGDVYDAATIAGMAFANAFLGICHSMAHKLGSTVHIPHGLANALMISHVIRYNATEVPFKQAIFPQYKYPNAKWRYARIADYLGLGGNTEEEKVEKLVEAIENLKRQLDIPMSIKEALSGDDKAFYEEVEEMADQHLTTNVLAPIAAIP